MPLKQFQNVPMITNFNLHKTIIYNQKKQKLKREIENENKKLCLACRRKQSNSRKTKTIAPLLNERSLLFVCTIREILVFVADLTPKALFLVAEMQLIAPFVNNTLKRIIDDASKSYVWISIAIRPTDKRANFLKYRQSFFLF